MGNINNSICVIIFIILYKTESCHGIRNAKNILNKISNLTKNEKDKLINKYKRQETSYLPDIEENPLEYPGKDPVKLKIIREQWDNYYTCLNEQIRLYEPNKMIPGIATMSFAGTMLKLECGLCQSPDEAQLSPDWYYSDTYNRSTAELITEDKEFVLVSPFDGSLHNFNIQEYDAGLYYCRFKKLTGPEYYVHVADDSEPTVTVWPQKAIQRHHEQKDMVLPTLGIMIKSDWSEWTNCNRCGHAGRRMRYGYCMVYTNSNYDDPKHAQLSIFDSFRSGIPCRSKLLPPHILEDPNVRNRASEIMIGYCKVPCKDIEIFIEYDESGEKTIINNTNGTYSYMQQLPPIEPLPVRLPVFAKYNTKVILICPGNLIKDTPVLWTIGHQLLYNPTLKQNTKGRIIINDLNQIVFKKVQYSDTKTYSCWQEKELAGQIHLIVTDITSKQKFDRFITIVGITVVLGTFIYVFYGTYLRSRKMRK